MEVLWTLSCSPGAPVHHFRTLNSFSHFVAVLWAKIARFVAALWARISLVFSRASLEPQESVCLARVRTNLSTTACGGVPASLYIHVLDNEGESHQEAPEALDTLGAEVVSAAKMLHDSLDALTPYPSAAYRHHMTRYVLPTWARAAVEDRVICSCEYGPPFGHRSNFEHTFPFADLSPSAQAAVAVLDAHASAVGEWLILSDLARSL